MPAISVARRSQAFQYNGSNSAEMLAAFTDFNVAIDAHYTCSFTGVSGAGFTANIYSSLIMFSSEPRAVNDWMVLDKSQPAAYFYTPAEFAARYNTYEQASALITETLAFKTSLAATASAFGSMSGVTVNGLSNANFDVPIRPRQPTNAFTAVPALTGSASLLGGLSITGLAVNGTAQNASKLSTVIDGVTWYDRVRVNVANSGALQLAGAALLVHVSP